MKINKIPVVVTRGIVLFPTNLKVVEFGREKSKSSIKKAEQDFDSKVIVISQKVPLDENPSTDKLFEIGCLAKASIKKV
ncbi:LON peptidase substrate-binding domain-containing protein [Vibrio harveyi]|nr:LON peptidase substrate-binding domain-containing protein [Vibrio harveyi]